MQNPSRIMTKYPWKYVHNNLLLEGIVNISLKYQRERDESGSDEGVLWKKGLLDEVHLLETPQSGKDG